MEKRRFECFATLGKIIDLKTGNFCIDREKMHEKIKKRRIQSIKNIAQQNKTTPFRVSNEISTCNIWDILNEIILYIAQQNFTIPNLDDGNIMRMYPNILNW